MTGGPVEIGVDAANRLWYSQGRKAVTRPSTYKAAIADLAKKTTDPAARKSFDATLLAHACVTRQIISPDLPSIKKWQMAK